MIINNDNNLVYIGKANAFPFFIVSLGLVFKNALII